MSRSIAGSRPADPFLSTGEVVAASGLTRRQVDHAVRTGRLHPSIGATGEGSGNWWWWSLGDLQNLRSVAARLQWGMTLDAALRHCDPPLPAPPMEVRRH